MLRHYINNLVYHQYTYFQYSYILFLVQLQLLKLQYYFNFLGGTLYPFQKLILIHKLSSHWKFLSGNQKYYFHLVFLPTIIFPYFFYIFQCMSQCILDNIHNLINIFGNLFILGIHHIFSLFIVLTSYNRFLVLVFVGVSWMGVMHGVYFCAGLCHSYTCLRER